MLFNVERSNLLFRLKRQADYLEKLMHDDTLPEMRAPAMQAYGQVAQAMARLVTNGGEKP